MKKQPIQYNKQKEIVILRKAPYKFKGHDWSELGECWGIHDENDEILAIRLREYMGERLCGLDKKDTKRVAGDIRRFLKALGRCSSSEKPLYDGLANLGDEHLIHWTMLLLGGLWS